MAGIADLITPVEGAEFLQLGGPAQEPKLPEFVTRASEIVEFMTGRVLRYRTVTAYRLRTRDGYKLYPRLFPIDDAATVTVSVDAAAQTVWRKEADGNPDDFEVLVASDDPFDARTGLRNHLWRPIGWGGAGRVGSLWEPPTPPLLALKGHPYNILATFSGGYGTLASADTVPQDLKLAVCYVLQRIYRDAKKKETDVTVINIPQGGSISYLDNLFPKRAVEIVNVYRSQARRIGAA